MSATDANSKKLCGHFLGEAISGYYFDPLSIIKKKKKKLIVFYFMAGIRRFWVKIKTENTRRYAQIMFGVFSRTFRVQKKLYRSALQSQPQPPSIFFGWSATLLHPFSGRPLQLPAVLSRSFLLVFLTTLFSNSLFHSWNSSPFYFYKYSMGEPTNPYIHRLVEITKDFPLPISAAHSLSLTVRVSSVCYNWLPRRIFFFFCVLPRDFDFRSPFSYHCLMKKKKKK